MFEKFCALRVLLIPKFPIETKMYHLDETKLVFIVKRFTFEPKKWRRNNSGNGNGNEETITSIITNFDSQPLFYMITEADVRNH